MIAPESIVWQRFSGVGNIDVTVEIPPSLADQSWVLAVARCHFRDIRSGASGVGTATFTLSLDGSDDGVEWDCTVDELGDVGLNFDLAWCVPSDKVHGYTFPPDLRPHCDWTNPDADEVGWGLIIGIAPASAR